MIVAGLTGGIASGKSTVSALFEAAGAIIIDADEIAHAVVKSGLPAWRKIVDNFGRTILLPSGEIDRARLADIVFNNESAKLKLNRIVHPHVAKEISKRLERIKFDFPDAIVVLDIPLLFEAGLERGLAEVIVVYAPEATQLKRLKARDGLTDKEALSRVKSQMSIEEKKSRATIVIDNSLDHESTRKQAQQIYRRLQAKSREFTKRPDAK
jgi:dephospho-CoA kinase